MKIVIGAAVWMLAVGLAYLAGDIAFGSDINEYVQASSQAEAYIIGGLAIAGCYTCWFVLRKGKRLTDIGVPFCVLFAWGLVRRKILYRGGCGLVYSIVYEVRKSYGVRSVGMELDYVNADAVPELIIYAIAIVMFFITYLIYRCDSLMLAVAVTVFFMAAGAALSVSASAPGVVLPVVSLLVMRYALVHGELRLTVSGVSVPLTALCVCLAAASCLYNAAYDKGTGIQGVLLEAADRIEYVISGGQGGGNSGYYRVDGSEVNPTDEVVDEVVKDEKPEGNLYITTRTYVTYENGVWRSRDIGYSLGSAVFLEYDEDKCSRLADSAGEVARLRYGYSAQLADDIVQYIRSQMSYTTSPGDFDDEEDPVVYAVFEAHKGYCVHFASAAAIMLRSVGVPTRYNIGYMVPSSAWQLREDGSYSADILDKYSHAWIEAYDDSSDSWVLIDATPLSDRADALGIPGEPEYTSGIDGDVAGESSASRTEKLTESQTENQAEEQPEEQTEGTVESVKEEETSVSDGTKSAEDEAETGAEQNTGNVQTGSDAQISGSAEDSGTGSRRDAWHVRVIAAVCIAALAWVICVVWILVRRRIIVTRRRRGFAAPDRISAIREISAAVYDMLEFAGLVDEGAAGSPWDAPFCGADRGLLAENIAAGAASAYGDMAYANRVPQVCDIIEAQDFADFVACVQAAVYGGVKPDDSQMKSAVNIYDRTRAYCYWSLGMQKRLRWKYIKCFE